jgi:hypothetical protein
MVVFFIGGAAQSEEFEGEALNRTNSEAIKMTSICSSMNKVCCHHKLLFLELPAPSPSGRPWRRGEEKRCKTSVSSSLATKRSLCCNLELPYSGPMLIFDADGRHPDASSQPPAREALLRWCSGNTSHPLHPKWFISSPGSRRWPPVAPISRSLR